MNTNHNRIKVADLETNQANKILKTNQNGELEFSDSNNLQTENYNALDCITEGKPLDARQGKVLKDLIDNNSLDLASDSETQIKSPIQEDKKIVSRLKLFNWWEWAKSQTQIISGIWNFTNKVTLASGTTNTPALIMPNGTLTTIPQNGAIERDLNGKLWDTFSGIRTELVPTRFSKNIGGYINSMSYCFYKAASLQNDIIDLYNSSAGLSKIYPSNFNSRDNMFIGDIMDSEIIMGNSGGAKSFILRFETWRTASNGANPTLYKTFNYTWDASTMQNISIRIVYTRTNSNMNLYGNLGSYSFFINNIFQGAAYDIYDYGNNDLRLKLVNNTPGSNNAYVYPMKTTNQFIPLI